MPQTRSLAPAALLGIAIAIGPLFSAAALGTDEVLVQADETLSGISRRHGVAVSTLVTLNSIADANRIRAGQRLVIRGATAPPSPAAPASPAASSSARFHTVASGENLWSIARFYGVSLAALVAANGIGDPGRIRTGLLLAIPGTSPTAPASAPAAASPPAATSPAAPAGVRFHTVASGENLWSIARFYGVSLAALVAANGIGDPGRIRTGLLLAIPGTSPSAPASAPAAASPPAMSPWMAGVVAQRAPIRQFIAEEATSAGVPVAFALAVAWQESGWRQDVVSSAGAVGVMQLMPGTAAWIGEAILGQPVNTGDARDNVRAGVRLLAHYLARYAGNRELVLAAYYQGQGAADRHGIYPVSRPYIAAITSLVRIFGG